MHAFVAIVSRAAREPLVQFFFAAIVLFAANRIIHGPQATARGEAITISAGRVDQIANSYRLLSGRMPSRAELQALVEDYIDEEVGYREAIARGLDADDTIVRRRMRQKLEFLAEDADASNEPSEADLTTWLASHPDEYRLPGRISLRQVLADTDKRGARAKEDAAAFLHELQTGADPDTLGDASMLPSALPLTTRKGVAALFGEDFAARVFEHSGAAWFGPIASPFGSHAVLLLSQDDARAPTLDEMRDKLRSDWIESKRRAARAGFQARLRARYSVKVDWPEPYARQPVAENVPRLERPLDTIDGE